MIEQTQIEKGEAKRNSSIELLRIILMCMVLVLHANKDILFTYNFSGEPINIMYLRIQETLAAVSTDCFILITGYYSLCSKTINIRKVFDIIFLTCFYGSVLYSIGCMFGWAQFSIKDFVKCTIPFFFDKCWFINIYLVLCLFIPFINIVIAGLTKKGFQHLLIISLFLFSIWPAFFPNSPSNDNGYGIISFILLYLIGAYLRLYYKYNQAPVFYFSLYIIFSAITLLFFSCSGWTWHWISYNSPFIIFASISLFLLFQKFHFYSRVVNYISASVFAVFLIHTNQAIRPNVFVKWFAFQEYLTKNLLSVVAIHLFMIITVFCGCVLIDVLRKWIFCFTYDRLIVRIPWLNRKITIT